MPRACIAATVVLALAACSGMGTTPSMSSGSMGQPAAGAPVQQVEPGGVPMHQDDAADATPDDAPVSIATGKAPAPLTPAGVTTCATTPPQYQWIFKGACEKIMLKSSGGTFSLQTWDDITVKGSIGANNLKTTTSVYLADATGTGGDIETYKGKSFDKYKGEGTTFIYAVAVNQGSTAIKPVIQKNKPILQYVITDSKGLPGTSCGAAVLTTGEKGSLQWATLPGGPFKAKGKTVTITQYAVPRGFELPPKSPLYFAVNCFK
ncbi:MAG TPA: hypothetical protein VKR56_03835 [Candidatus Cybelea sp.]|nr:hypothetical protein [Candidatus Cybelea sp.]